MFKKYLTLSNLSTPIIAVFLLAILFVPDVKSWTIQGLMKIGLFQPEVSNNKLKDSSVAEIPHEVVFKDASENIIKLSSLRGKVVFINFWAIWCPPCLAEMPSINSLYNKYKNNKDVVFLMVDVDNKPKSSTTFMKTKKYDLPVHVLASPVPDQYFSGSMPTTVILDTAGMINFRHVGAADYSNPKISRLIDQLLLQ